MEIKENPLLLVERLKGYYRGMFGTVHGVDGVNLAVKEGEALGLAGESGCGKSTLAQLIVGITGPLLHYEGGKVIIDGFSVYDISREKLRTEVLCKRLAYIPQSALNSLNPTKRIRDVARDVVKERTGKSLTKDEIFEKVGGHIEKMGLKKEVLNLYSHELSGGMKQRVIIGISTLWNPKMLVLDEPTSALDVSTQKLMIKTLGGMKKRGMVKSMLYITHDVPTIRQICDRCAIMYCGKLAEIGAIDEILNDPLHPYVKGLISCIAAYEPKRGKGKLESLPGRPPDLRNPPPGCRFHPRCSHCMDKCKTEEPPEIEISDGRKVSCWLYAGD